MQNKEFISLLCLVREFTNFHHKRGHESSLSINPSVDPSYLRIAESALGIRIEQMASRDRNKIRSPIKVMDAAFKYFEVTKFEELEALVESLQTDDKIFYILNKIWMGKYFYYAKGLLLFRYPVGRHWESEFLRDLDIKENNGAYRYFSKSNPINLIKYILSISRDINIDEMYLKYGEISREEYEKTTARYKAAARARKKEEKIESKINKELIKKKKIAERKIIIKQNALARKLFYAEKRQRERELVAQSKESRKAQKIKEAEQEILAGFKICKKCEEEKPLVAYDLAKIGYLPSCKQCYYNAYKDKRKIKIKEYQQNNRAKIRAYEKVRKSMPVNRMRASMKNRLKALFFRKGDTTTAEIIGLPLKEFKTYMESQFKEGMSWDNYGKIWDVDHYIPCRAFNHDLKDHVMRCWNYKNLRPEFKSENYAKHDKMSNGLSARAMIEGDPKLFFEVRNQMLREIGLPEIYEDAAPPTPIPLNLSELETAQ